jgi:hypothetical protein
MSLKKTLVYLEELQLQELKRRSRRSGSSMAAHVREAVARYLAAPAAPPLEDFIGCGAGPVDDDASERADEILKGLLG